MRQLVVGTAKRLLGRMGFEIHRSAEADSEAFYRPSDSCQIAWLGSIYEQFFGARDHGCFIEVGAYDGLTFSNTSCLATAGWSGVLIEPVPEFAAKCRKLYEGNDNVLVLELAIGASSGVTTMSVAGPLSTTDPATLEEYRRSPLNVRTSRTRTISVRQEQLDDVLNQGGVAPGFDVLVIDVEGGESEVLTGFNIDYWRPRMMIIELSDIHPYLRSSRAADAALRREITSVGYEIIYKDVVNTIFIDSTHASHVYQL